MEEYLERLAAVLKRPEEYNLRANREICNLEALLSIWDM